MPTVDLYGRNPDLDATRFTYPSALVEDMPSSIPPGARFFFKPPESNPVIGAEPDNRVNINDTWVRLDPNNVFYMPGVSSGVGTYSRPVPYNAARLGIYTPGMNLGVSMMKKPREKTLVEQGIEATRKAVKSSVAAFKDPGAQQGFSVAGKTTASVWSEMAPVTKVVAVVVAALVLKKVF